MILRSRDANWAAWAPPDGLWSRWVKPVLFAHLPQVFQEEEHPPPPVEVTWAPPPSSKVALVIDLPGPQGVMAGLALAAAGFRPIPLYNAIPPPPMPLGRRATPAVDVRPILMALTEGERALPALALPPAAPPAFLLDFQRRGARRGLITWQPITFLNRSVCVPSDFPSATFLKSAGITWVLLVQNHRLEPQPDLAEVLQGWKDGGLPIDAVRLDTPFEFVQCPIRPTSLIGRTWRHAVDFLELRRNPGGGFGMNASAGG